MRFNVLLALCLAGGWFMFSLPGCAFEGGDEEDRPGRARHVILFIADGMQLENEIAASRYLSGRDFALSWHDFPARAFITTWDVDTYNAYASDAGVAGYEEASFDPLTGYDPSLGGAAPFPLAPDGDPAYLDRAATDSASAATALATGVKTESGNLSWRRGDPPDGALVTIAEKMRAQRGAAIGVVSTVPASHATPAAFVSHTPSRSNYEAIAEEIIFTTRPEAVIGGGHPDWSPGYVSSAQLGALRVSPEYFLAERTSGLDGGVNLLYAAAALPEGLKLFGLFGGGGGNFQVPIPYDHPGFPGFAVSSEDPSLAEAAEAALMVLSRDPDGFFLMAEAGDIDWANHANDFAGMIGAVWQLDRAVAAARDFVTRPGDGITWNNTLLIVSCDHATGGLRLNPAAPLGPGDLPEQIGGSYPGGEAAYHTGGHTNELVTLYAKGARQGLVRLYSRGLYPGTPIMDNADVYRVMAEAAEVE